MEIGFCKSLVGIWLDGLVLRVVMDWMMSWAPCSDELKSDELR